MQTRPIGLIIFILSSLLLSQSAVAIEEASVTADNSEALWWLVGFVTLALGVSFLCSVAETVLLSVTPAYIAQLKTTHPARAALLKQLRQDNIDRSLAAILTMNTIAHTVGAIEAGAQSAVVFGSSWVGLFSAVMTLMILFFSEIIPKTLGAVHWSKLITPTLWYIRILIVLMYPLVHASQAVTRLITRNNEISSFSREEFIAMAGLGAQSGEIDETELGIIHSVFHSRSLRVVDIMTPRSVIAALPGTMTIQQAIEATSPLPFSRILIYQDNLDDVVGFVLKSDLLKHTSDGQQQLLVRSLRRPVEFVPDSMSLPKLFEVQLQQRQHITLVVDEYGSTKGLVTLEDTIETMLGLDIVDESDDTNDMRLWARKRWEERAKQLGVILPNIEDLSDTQTTQTGTGVDIENDPKTDN